MLSAGSPPRPIKWLSVINMSPAWPACRIVRTGAERARINFDELGSIFCSEDLPPQIPQICQSKPHRADFRVTTVEPGNYFQFFGRRGLVSIRIIVRWKSTSSQHHMLRGHTSAPRRAPSAPSRQGLHKVRLVTMFTSDRRQLGDRMAHPMFWKRWHA